MSIFGPNVDITEISDNPFYIPANTYYCFVKDVSTVEREGKLLLTFEYQIDDVTNDYHGKLIRQTFSMPPAELSNDQLDVKQKETLSFLKGLCRRGFGMSEEELAKGPNPSDFMGQKIIVTTKLNPGTGANEGKEFVNVKDAVTPEVHDEEKSADTLASEMGL